MMVVALFFTKCLYSLKYATKIHLNVKKHAKNKEKKEKPCKRQRKVVLLWMKNRIGCTEVRMKEKMNRI